MAKLNKEQLKKLYDYGGTLSPKDWADMIDSVVPDLGSGEVIETTYEEAKALYERNEMIPNVLYSFPYTQCRVAYIDMLDEDTGEDTDEDSSVIVRNTILDFCVYLDISGNLKCKGYYNMGINSEEFKPRYFNANYTFDSKIAIIKDNNNYYIEHIRNITETFNVTEESLNVIKTSGLKLEIINKESEESEEWFDVTIKFEDVIIFDIDIYDDMDDPIYKTIYMDIHGNGFQITEENYEESYENIAGIYENLNPNNGTIYDLYLDNGYYHSYLVEGVSISNPYTFKIEINANVHNDINLGYIIDSFNSEDLGEELLFTTPYNIIINSTNVSYDEDLGEQLPSPSILMYNRNI